MIVDKCENKEWNSILFLATWKLDITQKANKRKLKDHWLKSSYEGVISMVEFFDQWGPSIQHWWKKCVELNRKYVEKLILFGHILWEYFGQATVIWATGEKY